MKPKKNRKADKSKSNDYDRCQTPFYALDPLLPHLDLDWIIWESAAGEGNVVSKLTESGFSVVSSDVLTGQNFFDYVPQEWDCQITNPPYSIKYKWLERSCLLGKPFALLMPVDVLGAAKGQRPIEEFGIEVILLDKRVNFKMPNLGYGGNGAQFPTAWFTRGLNIGKQLSFGKLSYYEDEQLPLLKTIVDSPSTVEQLRIFGSLLR